MSEPLSRNNAGCWGLVHFGHRELLSHGDHRRVRVDVLLHGVEGVQRDHEQPGAEDDGQRKFMVNISVLDRQPDAPSHVLLDVGFGVPTVGASSGDEDVVVGQGDAAGPADIERRAIRQGGPRVGARIIPLD